MASASLHGSLPCIRPHFFLNLHCRQIPKIAREREPPHVGPIRNERRIPLIILANELDLTPQQTAPGIDIFLPNIMS